MSYGLASAAINQINHADNRAELIFVSGDYGFPFRFAETDTEVFNSFQSCEACRNCLTQQPKRVPIKGFSGVDEEFSPVIGLPAAILHIFQPLAEQPRPRLTNSS